MPVFSHLTALHEFPESSYTAAFTKLKRTNSNAGRNYLYLEGYSFFFAMISCTISIAGSPGRGISLALGGAVGSVVPGFVPWFYWVFRGEAWYGEELLNTLCYERTDNLKAGILKDEAEDYKTELVKEKFLFVFFLCRRHSRNRWVGHLLPSFLTRAVTLS